VGDQIEFCPEIELWQPVWPIRIDRQPLCNVEKFSFRKADQRATQECPECKRVPRVGKRSG